MKFTLIDHILDRQPDRIIAIKQVTLAEEYLGDHFPGFPVLPGVMMVEAMAQAARELLADRTDARLVLGETKAIRFTNMVRPGEQLEVDVQLVNANDDGSFACKGSGRVRRANSDDRPTAVAGRFTMRPIRTEDPQAAPNHPVL